MLERLRERSLQEPEPGLVEEERISPVARFKPSALGLSPVQTFMLSFFFFANVLLLSCACLMVFSKICPGQIC